MHSNTIFAKVPGCGSSSPNLGILEYNICTNIHNQLLIEAI